MKMGMRMAAGAGGDAHYANIATDAVETLGPMQQLAGKGLRGG